MCCFLIRSFLVINDQIERHILHLINKKPRVHSQKKGFFNCFSKWSKVPARTFKGSNRALS